MAKRKALKKKTKTSCKKTKLIHRLNPDELVRAKGISRLLETTVIIGGGPAMRKWRNVDPKVCYIFSQEAGGSAVCVLESGLIITNAHCLDEGEGKDTNEEKIGRQRILVSGDGVIVLTKCTKVDNTMDTATLQVVGVWGGKRWKKKEMAPFPSAVLYDVDEMATVKKMLILCVGVTGFQRAPPNLSLFGCMVGKYLGVRDEENLFDNCSGMGQLIHDCPTFWGTSGAPLFARDGRLVGLHNSYDTCSYSRGGVHLEVVKKFIKRTECTE